jgi:hypothetical protein
MLLNDYLKNSIAVYLGGCFGAVFEVLRAAVNFESQI